MARPRKQEASDGPLRAGDQELEAERTRAYYCGVSRRLCRAVEQSKKSQHRIVAECERLGVRLGQGTLSKILSYHTLEESKQRQAGFSMLHAVCICRAVGASLDSVIGMDSDPMALQGVLPPVPEETENKRPPLVYDPKESEFNGYLGEFQCYFYPTISSERNSLLTGRLGFTPDYIRGRCDARLELVVDSQRDKNNKSLVKTYVGTLVISVPQNSCYCILTNMSSGEICMINFHHRYFVTDYTLQCRLACALTTSAGENRRPTIHRMLIVNSDIRLSPEQLENIKPQLLLNNKRIVVPREQVDELCAAGKIPPEIAVLFGEKRAIAPREYYSFDESIIHSADIEYAKRAKALSLLRKFSTANRYNKASSKADDLIFKYLNSQEDDKPVTKRKEDE